jgi:hypothetical protein
MCLSPKYIYLNLVLWYLAGHVQIGNFIIIHIVKSARHPIMTILASFIEWLIIDSFQGTSKMFKDESKCKVKPQPTAQLLGWVQQEKIPICYTFLTFFFILLAGTTQHVLYLLVLELEL